MWKCNWYLHLPHLGPPDGLQLPQNGKIRIRHEKLSFKHVSYEFYKNTNYLLVLVKEYAHLGVPLDPQDAFNAPKTTDPP